MRLAPWILVAAVLAAPGVARAGSAAILIPPLEVEVGQTSTSTPDGRPIVDTEILVGLSWASLFPRSTPVDLSLGFVAFGNGDATPGASARMVEGGEDDDGPGVTTGTFVAADVRVYETPHWRTWMGGRGEVLHVDGHGRLGGFGRISTEVWLGAAGSDHNGFIVGTVALTLWGEIGVRERGDRSRATVVGGGAGLRIPFMFASG